MSFTEPLEQGPAAQNDAIHKQKGGSKRRPPPKPVRLTWGPSDVRQRVTLGQAIDQAEARNASAQAVKEKADQRKSAAQKKKEAQQKRKDQLAEQKARQTTEQNASAVAAAAAAEEERLRHERTPSEDLEEARLRQEEENLAEWQAQQYPFIVTATLKAQLSTGFRVKWSQPVMTPEHKTEWHKGTFNADELNRLIHDAMEQYIFEESLVESIAWIKSDGSRQGRIRVSLTDLSMASWDAQVEPILEQEWVSKPGYRLVVTIECIGRMEPSSGRRPIGAVDSPANSPAHRRTRTVQQEENMAYRRDRNEHVGDFSE